MPRLPIEVAEIICRHLEPEDVFNFRLCCRNFAQTGFPFMMPEVVFSFHSVSQHRLKTILSHSELCRNVKSLRIAIDALADPGLIDERNDQQANAFNPTHEQHSVRGMVGSWITEENRVLEYQKLNDELKLQREMFRTKAHLEAWRQVLTRMTKLQSLSFVAGNHFQSKLAWAHENVYGHFGDEPGNDLTILRGKQELDMMLRIAHEAGAQFKKLHIGVIHWSYFDGANTVRMDFLGQSLARLTTFKLLINVGHVSEGVGEYVDIYRCADMIKTGGLRRFIQSLSNLQSLAVIFDNFDIQVYQYGVDLKDLIEASHTWPQLRKLKLGVIDIVATDFLSFANRHAHTLRAIELHDVVLDGVWKSLLDQLRNILDLKHASIYGNVQGYDIINEDGEVEEQEWIIAHPRERRHKSCGEEEDCDPMRLMLSEYAIHGGHWPL